jgi:hypothetical protein
MIKGMVCGNSFVSNGFYCSPKYKEKYPEKNEPGNSNSKLKKKINDSYSNLSKTLRT